MCIPTIKISVFVLLKDMDPGSVAAVHEESPYLPVFCRLGLDRSSSSICGSVEISARMFETRYGHVFSHCSGPSVTS